MSGKIQDPHHERRQGLNYVPEDERPTLPALRLVQPDGRLPAVREWDHSRVAQLVFLLALVCTMMVTAGVDVRVVWATLACGSFAVIGVGYATQWQDRLVDVHKRQIVALTLASPLPVSTLQNESVGAGRIQDLVFARMLKELEREGWVERREPMVERHDGQLEYIYGPGLLTHEMSATNRKDP